MPGAHRAATLDGVFNWVDLRTTDLAAAMRFYAEVLGWKYTAEYGDDYPVALVAGDAVAGLKMLREGQAAGGDAPFWLNYVAVDGADAAAARTRELGGTVRAEPFDRQAERLTVIDDPTGGRLCLRQSPDGVGACRVGEPGCLAWNELRTGDPSAAIRFYTGLFGWRIESGTEAGRWTIDSGGGVRELDTEPGGYWLPYFAVASLEAALTRVTGAGGQVLDGPPGRRATVRDPQGAMFSLLE